MLEIALNDVTTTIGTVYFRNSLKRRYNYQGLMRLGFLEHSWRRVCTSEYSDLHKRNGCQLFNCIKQNGHFVFVLFTG